MEAIEAPANSELPGILIAGDAKDVPPAARIAALETEIQELIVAHSKEKEELLETLNKKTQQLDVQRIKLNRYELAIKEAGLFLGRPLLSYDDWLNGAEGADPLSAFTTAVAEANRATATPSQPAYSYAANSQGSSTPASSVAQKPKQLSTAPTSHSAASAATPNAASGAASQSQQSIPNKSNHPSSTANNLPAALAERQQAHKSLATDAIAPRALPSTTTSLESQCLECMRLALNFLLSAQRSVRAIDNGTYFSTPATDTPRLLFPENESTALLGPTGAESPSVLRIESMMSPRQRVDAKRVIQAFSGTSPVSGANSTKNGQEDSTRAFLGACEVTPNKSTTMSNIPIRENGSRPSTGSHSREGAVTRTGMGVSLSKRKDDDEQDDGDLSTNLIQFENRQKASLDVKKAKCDSCRELMIQIDHLNDRIKELDATAVRLEKERENEISAKKRLQRSKEIMDQELEELTSQLFEQANILVADHARQHDEIEKAYRALNSKYLNLQRKLQATETEMKGFKKILYDLQATQMQMSSFALTDNRERISGHGPRLSSQNGGGNSSSSNASQPESSNSVHEGGSSGSHGVAGTPSEQERITLSYSHTIVSGFDTFESSVAVDGVIFQEFQDHIKTMALAATQPPVQALITTSSTVFMKRCISEDVQPCLFYSYYMPVVGINKNAYGTGLALSFKKRLIECAMRGQCEIKLVSAIPSARTSVGTRSSNTVAESGQQQTPSQLQPQSQGQNPSSLVSQQPQHQPLPRDKCTMCTITRDCEYAIRLLPVQSNAKEWTALCRFCRDRMASVLDFFTYAGYMRQGVIGPGKQGATILSIFRQMLWLRRRMSVSRIGSCSVFETTLSAITGPGGGGDWEMDIKILP